jgi:hypothetical protein
MLSMTDTSPVISPRRREDRKSKPGLRKVLANRCVQILIYRLDLNAYPTKCWVQVSISVGLAQNMRSWYGLNLSVTFLLFLRAFGLGRVQQTAF